MNSALNQRRPKLAVANYCVAFIDLLGQKAALQGEGMILEGGSTEHLEAVRARVMRSVGAILDLQRRADHLLKPATTLQSVSGLREQLDASQQAQWDAMGKDNVVTQRWSDGLMHFSDLADPNVRCRMTSIFRLLSVSGALCFLGLAGGTPVRGGVEVAWGVELHPGELYGAAVARAYELESDVAKHPRIAVGPSLVQVIEHACRNEPRNVFEDCDRNTARTCMSMLKRDLDGTWIIDFIGEGFYSAVTRGVHGEALPDALKFVQDQLKLHSESGNNKLVERYKLVAEYLATAVTV